MKHLLSVVLSVFFLTAHAQRVESIHFHLYTDSLKKGTHNYINIDGKMSDGSWRPLTDKEIIFASDYGSFEGNNLVLPENPSVNKITVTATLKSDKKSSKQVTIWIKQKPDPPLPVYRKDGDPRRRK